MTSRLPPSPHEWINRNQSIRFEFEGEQFRAYAGDVISSALMAAGKRMLARSFKYHRPRGVLSFANHDANLIVQGDGEANVRADITPVTDGASYRAVNTIGGLRFDAARVLGLLSPLLPTGFYYKAFYSPQGLFPWWEKLIRWLAGLGRVDLQKTLSRQSRHHQWCDVLIVGGGSAGLSAAATLAEAGVQVVLADDGVKPGGCLNHISAGEDAEGAWLEARLLALRARDNVSLLSNTTVVGIYADHEVVLLNAGGVTQMHAKAIIVASGVYEQPAIFDNNDLPGVMLPAAASRLARCYGVKAFDSGVMIAGHDAAYEQALTLCTQQIKLTHVVDIRKQPPNERDLARLTEAGITILTCASIRKACGRNEVSGLLVDVNGQTQQLSCDGVLMAVGVAPAAAPLVQAGAAFKFDAALGQHVPHTLPEGVFAAGSVNGVFSFDDCQIDGERAAQAALNLLGHTTPQNTAVPRARSACSHSYPIGTGPLKKAFVDFDEDLSVRDLKLAAREGFDSVELMKRYSTIGMGPSQGKTSNMNGVRVLAEHLGKPIGDIGLTTPRPFVTPVPVRALAGRRIRREWRTPLHQFHIEAGARMQDAGLWRRPMSYAHANAEAAIRHEYHAVRERVGMIDVSTLGKIELVGADAEKLLNYAYPCRFDRLADGMTRYVFMTDGAGTLIDDGVCARLNASHFYLTTTSSQAAHVVRLLELYAVQLAFEVTIIDRTQRLGAINLAGPLSREVLARLSDLKLGQNEFPYLGFREGQVAGVEARVMRVGFVGELGYEIHVPANSTAHVWRSLLEAGKQLGIAPFGVDTQRLLRLEKGHLIVGQDSDGNTNPYEVGLGRAIAANKSRFHGRHALSRLAERVNRTLIGFTSDIHQLEAGLLVIHKGDIAGHVTSVGVSPHTGCLIGLAMIKRELTESEQKYSVRLVNGALCTIKVAELPFYDAGNGRQHADMPTTTQPNLVSTMARAESAVLWSPASQILNIGTCNNMKLGLRGGDAEQTAGFIADLSAVRKRLLFGADSQKWLAKNDVPAKLALFESAAVGTSGLVVRTHFDQYLLIDGLENERKPLTASAAPIAGLNCALCDHDSAEFALAGPWQQAMLNEFCATQIEPQTMTFMMVKFAGCDVCLWQPLLPQPHIRLICSAAEASTLFQLLNEFVHEHSGQLIGFDDYRDWQGQVQG